MRTFWFIIKTKPGRELYASRNIARDVRSLKVYMPGIEGPKGRVDPLFPNHLFVLTHGQWRYLESIYGCTRVITFGEKPGTVQHRVMRALMKEVKRGNEARRPKYKYDENEPLLMHAGQFAGIKGLYRGTTPLKRICILLSLLGREVLIEQPAENVRALAA